MAKKQKQAKSTSISTIKGYLPIRMALPPLSNSPPLSTFIYIKEHIDKRKSHESSSSTLFVANAPANGPIRTDLLLKSVFEQYAEVERVTVARDPRKTSGDDESSNTATRIFRNAALFLDHDPEDQERGDGKFAHVVFSSGKEMKRASKAIREDLETNGIVQLDSDMIDALAAQSELLHSESSAQDEGEDNINEHEKKTLTGIYAVAEKYKQSSYRHMPRQQLMELCNVAMASYEQSEQEAEARAKRLAEEPDDDGFITVTHGSSATSFGDLQTTQHQMGRGKGSKRNRKRKADNRHGAGEFSDFYKFQWKEKKQKEMNDLKARFEEDLEKVKKMKAERAFRPF